MRWVWCTFEREGLHKWDDAVKHSEVAYLASLHRHSFRFKVWVEVFGDDREVEFIMLKHRLQELVGSWGPVVGSCEMMADKIVKWVIGDYSGIGNQGRHVRVSVSEDGECGALVECP